MARLKPTYDRQNSCRILPASSGFQLLPAFPNGNLAFLAPLYPRLKEDGALRSILVKKMTPIYQFFFNVAKKFP